MDNIELERKILEILNEDNYFEMVIKAKAFESEYKTSDFYKSTKRPLMEVLKETKIFYALQLKDFGRYLQELINGLSLDNISSLLNQAEQMFGQENNEIKESLEVLKDLNN